MSVGTRVTAISFDADGTLVDFDRAMKTALEASLEELRRHCSAAAALSSDDLRATRHRVAVELGAGARMEEIREAAFCRTLEELGSPDPSFAGDLTRLYLEVRFRGLRAYDDVIPALTALGAFQLGLVSNGNSYPEHAGLEGRFAFVFFAHDHGVRKPEAAFYERVLAAAGCHADELVHVGDSIENDITAAQAVGIRAVWLNRDRTGDVDSGAWAEIHTLAELPYLIAGDQT